MSTGSPQHLAVAKEELENAYAESRGIKRRNTEVRGTNDDPVITTTLEPEHRSEASAPGPNHAEENVHAAGGGHEGEEEDGEEMVVVIAGGMTSQLTYDGVDVCASRVAWEVGIDC